MNPPVRWKQPVFTLIAAALIAFYIEANGPSFPHLRAVDAVLLVAAGLCLGVAFSLFLFRRRG